jgi:hypothetical protein
MRARNPVFWLVDYWFCLPVISNLLQEDKSNLLQEDKSNIHNIYLNVKLQGIILIYAYLIKLQLGKGSLHRS